MFRQERSPVHPRSACPTAVVFWRTQKVAQSWLTPGSSQVVHLMNAVTCRLSASAESLNGMQLYKRSDEQSSCHGWKSVAVTLVQYLELWSLFTLWLLCK